MTPFLSFQTDAPAHFSLDLSRYWVTPFSFSADFRSLFLILSIITQEHRGKHPRSRIKGSQQYVIKIRFGRSSIPAIPNSPPISGIVVLGLLNIYHLATIKKLASINNAPELISIIANSDLMSNQGHHIRWPIVPLSVPTTPGG